MTRDEIIAIIKDKSHSPLRGALFTINIFGQVIQRANKDVVVDDNGFDFMIVEKQITNEDNFLDTILPARNDFYKLINTSKNEENWFENAIALHKATFFNEPLVNNSNATLGDSIFSDEQEKGINNVMTNWYKPIQDKIDGEKKLKEFVDRYDFLPIIKINNSEEPKNAIISIKECENCKKEKVNLGKDYDEDKREYIVADVVITQNSITKIPVTIKKGYDPNGLQDEDGIIKFSCDNSGVKIKIIDNDETDYDVDEDEYDLSEIGRASCRERV